MVSAKRRRGRDVQQKQKNVSKKMNWRKSLTLTMVAVVTLFVGCQLPQLVVRVGVLLTKLSSQHLIEGAMRQASNVASGLLVVNAAANFFVYCAVGNTFRRVLLELIGRRSARKIVANPNHSQNRKRGVELASVPKPTEAANNK